MRYVLFGALVEHQGSDDEPGAVAEVADIDMVRKDVTTIHGQQ